MLLRRGTARPIALAVGTEGELPTEFRLFVAGWNETLKGRFLFDEEAAASVMAKHREWGVDLAIDLEHQMLGSAKADPNARDARGWFQLAMREDGSLWAVNVRWTPDGAARLQEKRQRYISPAFEADLETRRILSVMNAAITAMPATHNAPALVAASVNGGRRMDPKLVEKALEAVKTQDSKAALELLESMLASAAGADAGTADTEPPPAADVMTSTETKDAPPAKGEDEEKPAAALAAASARILRLSGKSSIVEALEEVDTWRESHLALTKERVALAKERAALESAERVRLCAELVTLGAEFPSTVWADDKATAPKPRWEKMPIVELRTHVAEQRAARGGKRAPAAAAKGGLTPPADGSQGKTFNTPHGAVTLSARQLKICAELGAKPEDFAANEAIKSAAARR